MLEWKPPDPRLVALVRRLQDTARRRLGRKVNEKGPTRAGDDEVATDPPARHPGHLP